MTEIKQFHQKNTADSVYIATLLISDFKLCLHLDGHILLQNHFIKEAWAP